MPGRCRRAASIPAKSHGRRRCANCARRPTFRSVERLGEIAEWLNYDIPRDLVGQAWKGQYRGQTQKWFAVRFTGPESEIDIAHPAGTAHAEFSAWRWEPMQNVPDLVVPFKRAVYAARGARIRQIRSIEDGQLAIAPAPPAAILIDRGGARACRARRVLRGVRDVFLGVLDLGRRASPCRNFRAASPGRRAWSAQRD